MQQNLAVAVPLIPSRAPKRQPAVAPRPTQLTCPARCLSHAVCAAICSEMQGSAMQERVAAALAAAGAVSVAQVAALASAGQGVWSLVARGSAPPERWEALLHTCSLLLAARQAGAAPSPSQAPPGAV